ncbi:glycoside hydrolase family 97 protein [Flavobacterium sp.]|uniref:glycoside hydrolase family 97 protein n=1 Tax=Flavobacterium sp. TaxID=239 RepID=UPI002CF9AD25|nr:glycoside hydrolase family 97 catalytic domain-containing protein [Flavobacterium sp.]HSD06333.1 glycoside hydrolase family 97 catalytic domain-containing protein [Flavobacterium sp.]
MINFLKYCKSKNYVTLLLFATMLTFGQKATLISPNKAINAVLYAEQNNNTASWYLKVNYNKGKSIEITPKINLGISRNDQDFSTELKLIKVSKPLLINEEYTALHGKRSKCTNTANEIVLYFENSSKAKLNIIVRAYNDGLTFRYEFPEKKGLFTIEDELTSYSIPDKAERWLEKFDLSNEGLYSEMNDANNQQDWCYPALFKADDTSWFLIHEADVDRNYAASKLSNKNTNSQYKVTLPSKDEGVGEALPTITLPWKSPWRVLIIGQLSDIVESTLVDDVSRPSILTNTDWIQPGIASWNYWSNNHGTKDFKVVTEFADLAASMNWPYTLLDWEWDQMGNGGNLEDAIKYIHSKGIKPLMWYNSSKFKWITSTPLDRMSTHENRVEEFTKLNKLGVYGIKIDFFLSEKQEIINYYLDILEDAAKYKIMVYFHGCLVPRGWQRTYPHLMTYEAVRGAEWYNNGPEFTTTAAEHNNTLAFTRNVVGSMDYTPVTFTNSQFPHITSYGHELALSVVFESAIQHMADRPEGYYELPDAAKTFLKNLPTTWDDTKLLDGYPGKFTVIARKKGNNWFVGGINSGKKEKIQHLKFDFLPEGQTYKLILIADGDHDKAFSTKSLSIDKTSAIDVKMLRLGGFVASISPNN